MTEQQQKLNKKVREDKITKIRKRGDVTIKTFRMKYILKENYEQLYGRNYIKQTKYTFILHSLKQQLRNNSKVKSKQTKPEELKKIIHFLT